MNKSFVVRALLLLYLLLFLIPSDLMSQELQEPVINGTFRNISFVNFAHKVKEQFGITIIYKNEWIDDITVNEEGDSLMFNQMLDRMLSPSGINYFQFSSNLYYLTGKELVKYDKLVLKEIKKDTVPAVAKGTILDKQRVVVIGKKSESVPGTSNISGRLTFEESGEPVIGATVLIGGTYNAAITDKNGFYNLKAPSGSQFLLKLSSIDVQSDSVHIVLHKSGRLNFELKEQLIAIQEVVVKAEKYDNVRGMQMGFQKVDIKTIRAIPTILGERDILKVAQMLPGVQTVGEGASGFNVRGSATDQNLFIINEIPIYNTGHLFGFFSVFNPDMVNDFNLYKNNFPVEYGGRLASIFDISTRNGNKKKFGARGAISPVTASLMTEIPLIKDKLSFIVGGRTTYSNWILSRIDDPVINDSEASFYDLMAGIHYADDKNSFQVFGYYSNDEFQLYEYNFYEYENIGASLIYNKKLGEATNLKVAGVFSRYSNYQESTENSLMANKHEYSVQNREVKLKINSYKFDKHELSIGGNAILYDLDHGVYSPFNEESILNSIDLGQEQGLEYSFFVSDKFSLTDKFSLNVGLRYSLFNNIGPNKKYTYPPGVQRGSESVIDTLYYAEGESLAKYSAPEYRLSLNYKLYNDLSFKLSYNRMSQYIFMLSNTVAISPTDRWKLVDSYIEPMSSDQISLGFYKNINKLALETSVEFYVKKSNNVVEYRDGAEMKTNPIYESIVLPGTQDAYGAEFFVKRNAGRFTGWLSYAYSRSFITVDSENDWERINSGNRYPSNYDKPHSLSLVGNYKISRRFSISSNLVYNSGRPITYPSGVIYVDGTKVLTYSQRNEYRIPDYFKIDLSVNVEGNLKKSKKVHGSWSFSVYNLTGRNNAYSIYFKEEQNEISGYKLSIFGVPVFTVSYNFKLGNYAVN